MALVFKRPLAFADLAEIWSFIADDSEQTADRFLSLIESKLELHATQPLMGRLRDELASGLRCFPVRRYVVFYLPRAEGIDVVRVLHSARDIGSEDFGYSAADYEDREHRAERR